MKRWILDLLGKIFAKTSIFSANFGGRAKKLRKSAGKFVAKKPRVFWRRAVIFPVVFGLILAGFLPLIENNAAYAYSTYKDFVITCGDAGGTFFDNKLGGQFQCIFKSLNSNQCNELGGTLGASGQSIDSCTISIADTVGGDVTSGVPLAGDSLEKFNSIKNYMDQKQKDEDAKNAAKQQGDQAINRAKLAPIIQVYCKNQSKQRNGVNAGRSNYDDCSDAVKTAYQETVDKCKDTSYGQSACYRTQLTDKLSGRYDKPEDDAVWAALDQGSSDAGTISSDVDAAKKIINDGTSDKITKDTTDDQINSICSAGLEGATKDDCVNRGKVDRDNKIATAACSGGDASQCKDDSTCTTAGGSWENGACAPKAESDPCRDNAEGFQWFICPLVNGISKAIDTIMGFITDQMNYTSLTQQTQKTDGTTFNPLMNAWQAFLPIANIIFVIVFLIIIYSAATSSGFGALSNYDIKKILPRLIIAAVLVNISFYACAALVDLSNIAGAGVKGIFDTILTNISTGSTTQDNLGGAIFGGIFGTAFGIIAGIVGVVVILLNAGTVLIAFLTVLALLSFRSVLITVLIIISPIAFALWLLPNTKKLFDRWLKEFTRMLFIFPALAAIWGASRVLVAIIMQNDANANHLMTLIMTCLVSVMPALAILPIMKMGGQAMGALQGLTQKGLKATKMDQGLNKLGQAGGRIWGDRIKNGDGIMGLGIGRSRANRIEKLNAKGDARSLRRAARLGKGIGWVGNVAGVGERITDMGKTAQARHDLAARTRSMNRGMLSKQTELKFKSDAMEDAAKMRVAQGIMNNANSSPEEFAYAQQIIGDAQKKAAGMSEQLLVNKGLSNDFSKLMDIYEAPIGGVTHGVNVSPEMKSAALKSASIQATENAADIDRMTSAVYNVRKQADIEAVAAANVGNPVEAAKMRALSSESVSTIAASSAWKNSPAGGATQGILQGAVESSGNPIGELATPEQVSEHMLGRSLGDFTAGALANQDGRTITDKNINATTERANTLARALNMSDSDFAAAFNIDPTNSTKISEQKKKVEDDIKAMDEKIADIASAFGGPNAGSITDNQAKAMYKYSTEAQQRAVANPRLAPSLSTVTGFGRIPKPK